MSLRLKTRFIPAWKQAPFIRLIIPLMAGIVGQWYLQFSMQTIAGITAPVFLFFFYCFFTAAKSGARFGSSAFMVLIMSGCWLVYVNDPYRKIESIKTIAGQQQLMIATIDEPVVAKINSYKANATIQLVDSNNQLVNIEGKTILYFAKDSVSASLKYGDQLFFKKPLSEIANSGNPGAFDYRRYAAFNRIFFQVYLKRNDYQLLTTTHKKDLYNGLYAVREFVIYQFKKYIPGPTEAGLAEALLLGYKDDLDKNVVEDYVNTGVVHIIAISGMHLGLIYGLLLILFKPLNRKQSGKIIGSVLIITALWLFSFLTGAAPSITRSALMFTAIIFGNSLGRNASIYNSLAVSAFILLLVNPFNLWDVGFQLSYAAVISIAILSKPVTGWITFSNKWLQKSWQLIAVTIAAQVFTMPFVIYHFHQFPLLFIFSNLLAVPLSSLILYGLILLLPLSIFPVAAKCCGIALMLATRLLNRYIGFIASISFSRIDGIYITIVQALLLMIVITFFCIWLLHQSVPSLMVSLLCSLLLLIMVNLDYVASVKQQKLIIYNVPKKIAIDVIDGRSFTFIGDTALAQKSFLQNFHLLPSRIVHHVEPAKNMALAGHYVSKINFNGISIFVLDKTPDMEVLGNINAKYLYVEGGCKTKPSLLLKKIACHTVVLGSSVQPAATRQWQIAADSLHLRLHSIQQQGAFQAEF